MPSPKHLWSGDWQDESAAAAARRRPAEPAPDALPPEPESTSNGWRNWRLSAAAGLGLLLIAGVAVALLIPGSSRRASGATVPFAQAAPGTGGGVFSPPSTSPAAPGSGPGTLPGSSQTGGASSGAWLGVDVSGTASGVVIEGIIAGGPADAAALRPGDQLLAIGDRPIHSLSDLSAVVAGLAPGQTVTMHLRRGGATISRALTVGTNPSASAASP